jgi:hypothetical protein
MTLPLVDMFVLPLARAVALLVVNVNVGASAVLLTLFIIGMVTAECVVPLVSVHVNKNETLPAVTEEHAVPPWVNAHDTLYIPAVLHADAAEAHNVLVVIDAVLAV